MSFYGLFLFSVLFVSASLLLSKSRKVQVSNGSSTAILPTLVIQASERQETKTQELVSYQKKRRGRPRKTQQ